MIDPWLAQKHFISVMKIQWKKKWNPQYLWFSQYCFCVFNSFMWLIREFHDFWNGQ